MIYTCIIFIYMIFIYIYIYHGLINKHLYRLYKDSNGIITAYYTVKPRKQTVLSITIWLFNIAMENPYKWRFLVGKIIYFYGPWLPRLR